MIGSTKLRGAQRSRELGLRRTDFRAPENLIFPALFMNSENSKTFKQNVLIPKLTDNLDLRIGEKVIALSNLSIYYASKNKNLIQ